MATTFSDGSRLAALRWSGPFVPIETALEGALASRAGCVFRVARGRLTPLGDPFGSWPPALGASEQHDRRPFFVTHESPKVAVLENGEILSSPGVTRWRPGHPVAVPDRLEAAAFEVTPEGALYTVRFERRHYFVGHRTTSAFDEVPRELGRVTAPKSGPRLQIRTTLLADGALLVAVIAPDAPGRIGLYRARATDGSFEALQLSPGARKRTPERADVVSVGNLNYLVASPRTAWFVTSNQYPLSTTSGWPPIHVYELVGERLELARPAFSVPQLRHERPVAVAAIGNQVAMALNGPAYSIVIADGIVAHRGEGAIARKHATMHPESLLASPAGDALLFAFATGIARCELLRDGDPRLATEAYDEPAPPPSPPEPPPLPPLTRDDWIERVRLHQVIRTISFLHFGNNAPEHGFEGDATSGRFWSINGQGGQHAIGWSEAGVVAFGFDSDCSRERPSVLIKNLPEDLKAFGEKLAKWKPPACDIAWYSVAEKRGGNEKASNQLDAYLERDDAKRLAAWRESSSISEAQLALAISLTRASRATRHVITDDEARVLLARPEGVDETPERTNKQNERKNEHLALLRELAKKGSRYASVVVVVDKGQRTQQKRPVARRLFAAVGIDWDAADEEDKRR